jgi:hypothetical protein
MKTLSEHYDDVRRRAREHLAEAEALVLLPRSEQLRVLAVLKATVADKGLTMRDRCFARERLVALQKHLRRLRRKAL